MRINRLVGGLSVAALLYIVTVFVGVRYFLNELIFIKTPEVSTTESSKFKVSEGKHEVIVRVYEANSAANCVVFFTGRSGGIQRYESELFEYILNSDVSIYAVSLPGYDGAGGRGTFENVQALGRKALERINKSTLCKIDDSVFVGRSLGAAVAAELARSHPPAGMLVDSIAPSLSVALRAKLKEKWYTLPAAYLPLEVFMPVNPELKQSFSTLRSNVIVLQGSEDLLAPYELVKTAFKSNPNVKVIEIKGATHSNAHIVGRSMYLKELAGLFKAIEEASKSEIC